MINPELERRYADCLELVDAWKSFLELVNKAIRTPEQINPAAEQQFLAAKARVAMLHDSFMAALKHDKQTGNNMIEIVNRAISLRLINRAIEAEQKKLELEWHEAFLLLNETVSSVNEEREALAKINEMTWKLGRMRERAVVQFKAFVTSLYFKVFLGVMAVLFVIWGIPAFGIYDYDKLRDVNSLKGPLGSYYDLKRDMIGMSAPYMNLAKFAEKMNSGNNKANKGNSAEHNLTGKTSDLPKDTFLTRVLPQQMIPTVPYNEQKELYSLLNAAQEYDVYQYSGQYSSPRGYIYLFWFRKSQDASNVFFKLSGMDSKIPGDKFKYFKKQNVIMILHSPFPPDNIGNLSNMRDRYADAMK